MPYKLIAEYEFDSLAELATFLQNSEVNAGDAKIVEEEPEPPKPKRKRKAAKKKPPKEESNGADVSAAELKEKAIELAKALHGVGRWEIVVAAMNRIGFEGKVSALPADKVAEFITRLNEQIELDGLVLCPEGGDE